MKISKHSALVSVIGFLVMALAVLFIPQSASAQNTDRVQQRTATRPRVVIIAPTATAQPEIVQFEKMLNPNAAQLKVRFPRGTSNAAEIYGSFDRFSRSIYIAGSARTFSTGRIIHLPPLFRRR